METAASPKARIILELQPDGTLVAEHYTNGARTRTGFMDAASPMAEIMELLELKQSQLDHQAELKRKRLEAEAWQARHVPGNALPASRQAHADTAISDLVRVCHCGQEIRPFMEPCPDCPGAFGAGKAIKQKTTKQIWRDVASTHGVVFANKTVGNVGPKKYQPKETLASLPVDLI